MNISDAARHSAKEVLRESYVCVGYNYRLTDVQAAIGIEQLKRVPSIVTNRQEKAKIYDDAFGDIPSVLTPTVPAEVEFNYQSYALRLTKEARMSREALMQYLLDRGVSSRRGIMCIHREPAYRDMCKNVRLCAACCA